MNQVPSTDRWVLRWAAAPPVEPVVPETEWVWRSVAGRREGVRVCAGRVDEAEMPVVADAVAYRKTRPRT